MPSIIWEIPEQHCPHCSKLIDLTGQLTADPEMQPQPGDYSVCFGCGGVLVFETGFRLRMPTPDEIVHFWERYGKAFPPEKLS